jgi:mycofactocin precursor peptide MftA
MPETTTQPDVQHEVAPAVEEDSVEEALAEESLVEEVSIDGMCGVY